MHFAFLGRQVLLSTKFYCFGRFLDPFSVFIHSRNFHLISNMICMSPIPGPTAVRSFQHFFFEQLFFATGALYSKSRNCEYSRLKLFCFSF